MAGPVERGLPLWPLALLAGMLPLAAGVSAFFVSRQLGLVPDCNPFFDGCVSISRAARHGLANHLFRALMLPAATLQALVWLLAARWLAGELGAAGKWRAIAWLGVLGALALVLYGTFLGTEGATYRWLRRYGTVLYFGFTCICLLFAGEGVLALVRQGKAALSPTLQGAMLALAGTLVALGLGNAIVAAFFGAETKARIENVTEWWGGLIFVLGFIALAMMWRRLDLRLALHARHPRD